MEMKFGSSSSTLVKPHIEIIYLEILQWIQRLKSGVGVVFIEKIGAWKCMVNSLIHEGKLLSKVQGFFTIWGKLSHLSFTLPFLERILCLVIQNDG